MYIIEKGTKKEEDLILEGIIKYNEFKLPSKRKEHFASVNRVMKDSEGTVIGGIKGDLSYYFTSLYIDLLWVKEGYRKNGYGSKLLNEIEKIGKEEGCTVVTVNTMDFQAKDFYIKNGYEVFAELDNVPKGHKRYYMKKSL